MVKKIKICPQCKKWTVGSGEFCGNCGETLIVTEYTDMFFEKLSPIEQQEYVEKAIAGEQIMQEEVHTTESNTSLAVFLTDSLVVGKILQIMGDIIIFSSILVAYDHGKNTYSDFSSIIFLEYFLNGAAIGLITNGVGHIITLLSEINGKMNKE